MEKTALVIMAKVPSTGGKSRLGTMLTPVQREELQWAFLEDILDKAYQVHDLTVFIAITPQERADEVDRKIGRQINRMVQPTGDLGMRMFTMANQLFERGFGKVLITGTDIPTLPPDYLVRALKMLRSHPLVFGPTMDGGYYLVGLSYPESRIFTGISWSTSQVLQQTVSSCQRFNLPYCLLPPLVDIDWPKDLLALRKVLDRGNPNANWFPRRTANCLTKIFVREDESNGNLL